MTHADTLVHRIAAWAQKTPSRNALYVKQGDHFEPTTWQQYWTAIQEVGRGLIALGHEVGQCVAIVGRNRPEWVQAQFGIQAAAGVPAPIYVTATGQQFGYIVDNCKAKIAICDTDEQLEKYLAAERDGLFPRLEKIITLEALSASDERVMSFDALRELGRAQQPQALDERLEALQADETCLLIYTSGTTGTPKGVMLDHRGQLEAVDGVLDVFPNLRAKVPYRVVSYLPLSHQTEQLLTNVAAIWTGGEVYFCPDLGQIKDYLAIARPTVFMGVPRVWEKFEAALRAKLGESSGIKAALASWAMATELRAFKQQVVQGSPNQSLGRKLARALVIDKVKRALGLDQLVVGLTGAAPIAVSTQEFFASLGVCVYEGYGMSETSGVTTVTDQARPRFGTVGRPVRGIELRIASDGEIQLKGRPMTRGYLHLPEETAVLFTSDGWLRTGDLGELDSEGNLRITGRAKEILITAGGKNVAPVEMENHIKGIEGVGPVVVVGDGQPYLCALISLDPENLAVLCKNAGVATAPLAEVARSELVQRYLQAQVDAHCNSKVARYQQIKKVALMPTEFSVEGGEMTPTMKLRRKEIDLKYGQIIANFYADKNLRSAASG